MSSDDWLGGPSDDWLAPEKLVDIEPEPAAGTLPAVVALPMEFSARVTLAAECWERLSLKQRQFLTVLRECRYNARKASRQLGYSSSSNHKAWLAKSDYAAVFSLWQSVAAGDALNPDKLLARQDDIVEEALTPKPILHQGEHTGFEEVQIGVAARANETLMKAAGLLKEKTDIDVSIGIVGPAFMIQVVQPGGNVIDVTPRQVEIPALEVEEAIDAEWLEA